MAIDTWRSSDGVNTSIYWAIGVLTAVPLLVVPYRRERIALALTHYSPPGADICNVYIGGFPKGIHVGFHEGATFVINQSIFRRNEYGDAICGELWIRAQPNGANLWVNEFCNGIV